METNHPTIRNGLSFAQTKLAHLANAQIEAELLIGLATGLDRLDIITNQKKLLSNRQLKKFVSLVEERATGRPFAYLTGEKEFFGRTFSVTADTLIPRPETEGLINHAKTILKNKSSSHILDVGTGSGVIGITLALELPDCQVKATDVSAEALKIARQNAKMHQITNSIQFVEQNLLIGEKDKYDLVIANLPYVEREWLKESAQKEELAKEPYLALVGGEKGTELIEEFISQFIDLAPAHQALLEHGDNQELSLIRQVKSKSTHAHTFSYKDLSGKYRYLLISLEEL